MKVVGCTAAKHVVRSSMTNEDVIRHGIDVWKLDLDEEHPIAVESEGETLYFSPLRTVGFALETRSGYHIAVMRNGKKTCVVGTRLDRPLHGLSEPRRSPLSFDTVFRLLLETGSNSIKAVAGFEGDVLFTPPFNVDTIRAHGDKISFDYPLIEDFFEGEMFGPLVWKTDTGPQIQKLFELLGHLKPVVFGRAVTNSLSWRPSYEVRCTLPPEVEVAVKAVLSREKIAFTELRIPASFVKKCFWHRRKDTDPMDIFPHHLAFTIDGCNYQCTFGHEQREERRFLSIDMMECATPGLVKASSIAGFDYLNRQYRIVRGPLYSMEDLEPKSRDPSDRSQYFSGKLDRAVTGEPFEGFTFLPPR